MLVEGFRRWPKNNVCEGSVVSGHFSSMSDKLEEYCQGASMIGIMKSLEYHY